MRRALAVCCIIDSTVDLSALVLTSWFFFFFKFSTMNEKIPVNA